MRDSQYNRATASAWGVVEHDTDIVGEANERTGFLTGQTSFKLVLV